MSRPEFSSAWTAEPLGLIAGVGRFPHLVAAGARTAGRPVIVIAIKGLADADLRPLADRLYWSGIARLGRWIRVFRRHGVRQAVLAGAVRKHRMHDRWRWVRYLPDWTSIRVWYHHATDKRNESMLCAVADEMARKGITVIDSTQYCPQALAAQGLLTRRAPSPEQQRDVDFGWRIARELARLQIGQAVAVREQDVVAVEAIEGTDAMIARAGQLCPRGGWTLVKVADPQQDMRFDVPTVGPQTIRNLHAAKGAVLVIEANKTLVLEKEETLRLADHLGITLLARSD